MATEKELQDELELRTHERDAAQHQAEQWKRQHDAAQLELQATAQKLSALEAAIAKHRDHPGLADALELSTLTPAPSPT